MKKVLTAIVTFIFSMCLIIATVASVSAASVKKVTGFTASAKPTEVTLTWKKTSGAKGYEVQQKSGKKWKTVATIKKQKTTSYTVKKLKNGTTYQFRIRAVNGKKKGAYVTAKVKTGVQKITGVKATSVSLTSVKLTWDKANVTGYEIQRKDGKKWKTVTKIKKATDIIHVADGPYYGDYTLAYNVEADSQMSTHNGNSMTHIRYFKDSSFQSPSHRHSGKINFVAVAGNVQTRTPTEMNTKVSTTDIPYWYSGWFQ